MDPLLGALAAQLVNLAVAGLSSLRPWRLDLHLSWQPVPTEPPAEPGGEESLDGGPR